MSNKYTPLWPEAHLKSKSAKHTISGALVEVEMMKRCTARSAFRIISNSQVSVNADGFGAFLGVQMWFGVAGARESAPCQKVGRV